jgi:hypothetical protein
LDLIGVLTRRYTHNLFEAAGEMALAAQTNGQGHICQGMSQLNQTLCPPNAYILQVGVWRQANLGMEDAQQMVGAKGYLLRQVAEADALGEVLFKILDIIGINVMSKF